MKIAAAQINPIVGDLEGNLKKILDAIQKAKSQQADIVLFSELALTGYPPEDFLLLPHFIKAAEEKLTSIITASEGICTIVGTVRFNPHKAEKFLYNSAAIIVNGKCIGFYDKILLPTYDVFDERRYFEPGQNSPIWELKGKKIAVTICEDIWQHASLVESTSYLCDPILELKKHKPDLLLNLSASPYNVSRFPIRVEVCKRVAATLQCPVILCNQVGGNDSLIFDGNSLFVNPEGLIQSGKAFEEDVAIFDLSKSELCKIELNENEEIYKALVLGLRDYCQKTGFKKTCIGLSGGIDSALVACLAVDALGKENVLGLVMPSRYSSPETQKDAHILAENLGIKCQEISIEPAFQTFLDLLSPCFEGHPPDSTEENLQARIRGMILMAHSNKFGYLVLSTGNKSELAVGYSTLYGDMCGGLAVIGDVNKEQVYSLSKWINRNREIIPQTIISRAPSAELRLGQKDSDSLPPYEVLDHIQQDYIVNHLSPEEIISRHGYSKELVEDIIRRIHLAEYKRRQSPPGLRISKKAFSIGRRFPIVQGWVK